MWPIPEEADREIDRLTELGFGGLPVCVAKTQYSLSDDPTKLGAPQDFILTVRKVKVSAGARVHRGPDGGHSHHAGSAQDPGGRGHRRGRKRRHLRPVLIGNITR